ncbi:helix-turn-helix domain-containing protein [Lawsonibacter faecis]|jgi:DNA-binding helix-turn-helix protein|uniref:Helix-turn-helix transcriptional regulator n=1 Tax=Lawsonibacter faecis TaxID=2763052 RepID=A0A8J6JM41_9FIRM|nr:MULTISPECIES: helix-turn-helix transcriptional regulator [Oscillospiraceae]MTQ97465.1 helix-turn-helix domain-containing protein [Pseudoflavonifractor sp. BIOML-A16]MTR06573.1 helix-turn-helix domain-containing protein [Pseudoflavonifractor sp. BIOML-A15]MTR31954.1 helix-turn-helix domain-containing protein [Pseudoflavonifractor sp. BIOML-A14]MTR74058.1 helix-turn-helix domain-containing protein [Pseudoflavonifractor sp. BIOML-A18]MTS64505.1 helix-turn-helix domain-containing protein [Pseud
MNISDAVAERLNSLCEERGITINRLATLSAVTQSTVSDFMRGNTQNIGIITLKKLIDGLDLSITEFFDTETFRSLEQEIQ